MCSEKRMNAHFSFRTRKTRYMRRIPPQHNFFFVSDGWWCDFVVWKRVLFTLQGVTSSSHVKHFRTRDTLTGGLRAFLVSFKSWSILSVVRKRLRQTPSNLKQQMTTRLYFIFNYFSTKIDVSRNLYTINSNSSVSLERLSRAVDWGGVKISAIDFYRADVGSPRWSSRFARHLFIGRQFLFRSPYWWRNAFIVQRCCSFCTGFWFH